MLNQGYYAPKHFTTDTLVVSGSAILGRVNINTKGSSASVVTVYDGTTSGGTVVAIIDSLNQVGSYTFECSMVTGIFVTVTGTADVTVTYAKGVLA